MQISIRELKVNPSHYIRQAQAGHTVWLTSHKQVVARLVSVAAPASQTLLGNIPNVHWMGKKPNLNRPRPTLRGKSLADTVLEMR
jgi:prevent-host-death family protein